MFGIETLGRGVFAAWVPLAALAAGLAVGVLAVRHCRRVARPAIDFSLLELPTFHQATVAGSLFRTGAGATPFLVPMLLQLGFGRSASQAGLVSFATAVGALAMKPLARPLLRRFGFRVALAVNALLAALGIAICAAFTPAWPAVALFLVLALGGLARSLQFTALSTLAFADVPQPRLSAATSFFGTAQQLSPALGVVLATGSLEASAGLHGRSGLAVADFGWAFVVAGLVVASSAPFFLRLHPEAGGAVSGHAGRAGSRGA
jgi:MFS family permease